MDSSVDDNTSLNLIRSSARETRNQRKLASVSVMWAERTVHARLQLLCIRIMICATPDRQQTELIMISSTPAAELKSSNFTLTDRSKTIS